VKANQGLAILAEYWFARNRVTQWQQVLH